MKMKLVGITWRVVMLGSVLSVDLTAACLGDLDKSDMVGLLGKLMTRSLLVKRSLRHSGEVLLDQTTPGGHPGHPDSHPDGDRYRRQSGPAGEEDIVQEKGVVPVVEPAVLSELPETAEAPGADMERQASGDQMQREVNEGSGQDDGTNSTSEREVNLEVEADNINNQGEALPDTADVQEDFAQPDNEEEQGADMQPDHADETQLRDAKSSVPPFVTQKKAVRGFHNIGRLHKSLLHIQNSMRGKKAYHKRWHGANIQGNLPKSNAPWSSVQNAAAPGDVLGSGTETTDNTTTDNTTTVITTTDITTTDITTEQDKSADSDVGQREALPQEYAAMEDYVTAGVDGAAAREVRGAVQPDNSGQTGKRYPGDMILGHKVTDIITNAAKKNHFNSKGHF